MSITLPDDITTKLKALAKHQNRTPEDVLRDLLAAVPTPPEDEDKDDKDKDENGEDELPKRRTPGLGRGTIWVSDDFDDYLGDEFWFGES